MANTKLQVIPKQVLDFSSLQVGATQSLTLVEKIDVSAFGLGELELQFYSGDISGGSITFEVLGHGQTSEDPGLMFSTRSPLFPSLAVPSGAPAFVTTGGPVPGTSVLVRVTATRTSSNPLKATVSLTLVLRKAVLSPRDIGSCVLWLDMLEVGSYTVAAGAPNTVTSITNLISGVKWTESTNPPEFEAAGLNGRPCMKGNGTTTGIISAESRIASAISGNDQKFMVIAAIDPLSAPGPSECILGWGNSSNTNPRGSVGQSASLVGYSIGKVDDTGVTNITIARSTPVVVKPTIVTWTVGGTGSILVDNEATADPAGASIAVGQMTIDRAGLFCRPRPTPDFFTPARIGALLLFTSTDAMERDAIRGWLNTRWNMP